jgi:flagellar basal-body rod modification protein FlgD
MASTASAASGASSTTSSGSSSATISANDFLTLLVTEMQNQDPTADTDPNEYIDQLVQVNSLEQLIDINQNLSAALGDSTGGSANSATTQASGATASLTGKTASGVTVQGNAANQKSGAVTTARPAASSAATANTLAARASGLNRVPGNLSVPAANPAAQRVAHALDGRSLKQSIAGGLSGVQ